MDLLNLRRASQAGAPIQGLRSRSRERDERVCASVARRLTRPIGGGLPHSSVSEATGRAAGRLRAPLLVWFRGGARLRAERLRKHSGRAHCGAIGPVIPRRLLVTEAPINRTLLAVNSWAFFPHAVGRRLAQQARDGC